MSRRNYQLYYDEEGNGNYIPFPCQAVLPLMDCETLDDSLDYGKLVVSGTKRGEAIKPFTRFRLDLYEKPYKDAEMQFVLSRYFDSISDTIQQMKFTEPYIYAHQIDTIELTKELERRPVDTMTITKPLYHDYPQGANRVDWTYNDEAERHVLPKGGITDNGSVRGPAVSHKAMIVESIEKAFSPKDFHFSNFSYYVYQPLKSTIEIIQDQRSETFPYTGGFYEPLTDSSIEIKYNICFDNYDPTNPVHQDVYATAQATISVVASVQEKHLPTITSVIERLLSAGVFRTASQQQEFTLDPNFAEEWAGVMSPEFYFTRSTLRDALTTVGNYMHAIPRLAHLDAGTTVGGKAYPAGFYVTFDRLGGSEVAPAKGSLASLVRVVDSEDYCGGLNSYAENIINSRDLERGSIVEPCSNGFQTSRTEEGVLINNDLSTIFTSMPIDRVTKLEFFIEQGGTLLSRDMTPYVFTDAEYGTLSAYDAPYPYAKEYALVYARGQSNIRGLSFKAESLTGLNDPALTNILKDGFGISSIPPYKNIGWRVTYRPIITARVTQYKDYAGWDNKNVLFYNQGGNSLETDAYGDNMRGKLLMLGNEVEQRTYQYNRWHDQPKCGMLLDGKYVSRIERQDDGIVFTCTVTLTKDFNKLSEYMAINSDYRVFDVSERQSVERHVHADEFCFVGDDTPANTHCKAIGQSLLKLFTANAYGEESVSCAVLQGVSGSVAQQAVQLPALSVGFGTSILFLSKYEDNFAAGSNSNFASRSSQSGTVAQQKYVQYGDVYGEFDDLKFAFCTKSDESYTADSLASTADKQGIPNSLPAVPALKPTYAVVDYTSDPAVVQKDGREHLNVEYQLHFQATRKSIVIGSAFALYNALVATQKPDTRLFLLSRPINALHKTIDPSAVMQSDMSASVRTSARQGVLTVTATNAENAKAWAFGVKDEYGAWRLAIGENIENGVIPEIYFNF